MDPLVLDVTKGRVVLKKFTRALHFHKKIPVTALRILIPPKMQSAAGKRLP